MIEIQWDAMFDIPFRVIPITSFDTILPCPKNPYLHFTSKMELPFFPTATYASYYSDKFRNIATIMETKIETTNTAGKVLAYDGEELVGRLDFIFDRNIMSIEHTYAYRKGMGVGGMLVSAANDYAVSRGLKVKPVCSFADAWYERHPQFMDIIGRV